TFLIFHGLTEAAFGGFLVDLGATQLITAAHHVYRRLLAAHQRAQHLVDQPILDQQLESFWCFHRRLQVPSQLSRPAGYGKPHWPSMLGRKFESAQRIGIAQRRIDNSTHTPTEHRNARYRTLLASPLRTRRALRPKREGVTFHANAKAALAAGFRPCRRCSPQGQSPAEQLDALVIAACRLIDEAPQTPTLTQLAARIGVSSSHLARAFKART